MKKVEIVVKGVQSGSAGIAPYNHGEGVQFYGSLGSPGRRLVKYQVPAYEVYVSGTGPFRAIRFGLRNTGGPPISRRPCDTGLSHFRVCRPTWVPTYSPRSFQGRSRLGAWRLLPGQDFLIHEGPSPGEYAGSIGCIEIVDGKWGHFLWQIEDLAGVDCARLAAAGGLTVILEATSYPLAILQS